MQIDIRHNIRDVQKGLSDVARRQIPFATAMALNELGAELIRVNQKNMKRVFDRPTRWTLNAFHFVRATKQKQSIEIMRKTAARGRHYLEIEEAGGTRPLTGWERLIAARLGYGGPIGFVMPTGAVRRNAYGNVSRATMQRIIGGTSKGRKAGAAYFVPKVGSRLSAGVYQRKGKSIQKVLAFDARAPRYAARFKFHEVLRRHSDRRLPRKFEAALTKALATAR